MSDSHRAVLFEQRPGDELHQREQVDQPFLLQAQQAQHFTQLFTLHAATLQTQLLTPAARFDFFFPFKNVTRGKIVFLHVPL